MLPATRRRLLLSATWLLVLPGGAWAQAAGPAAPPVTDAQAAQAATAGATTAADNAPAESRADEIVVTGTRIARPEFAAPNPIVSFNTAAIQESGNTNLTNFLLRVPALTGSRDNVLASGGNANSGQQPFGGAGLNLLNLRNLGPNRTLVLVNGRRHVPSSFDSAAVDVNVIPTDLVQRVDVLTGSASSIYGADGVSGVVNFILKRDFDGVTGRVQAGITTRGDNGQRFGSLGIGHNFAEGRGNISLFVEHAEEDAVDNDQRTFLQQANRQYLIPNDAKATNPNAPSNILVGDLRYVNESPLGAVDVNGDGIPDYNGLGLPYRASRPAAYYGTGPSDDTGVAGFYSGDIAPQINRTAVNLLAHYDVSDAFKPFVEAKYVTVRATTLDYYNSIYGYQVPLTNPTVPATIAAAAAASGQSFVTVLRDNLDYGRHGESNRRRTYRGVIGATGRLTDHATYEASYTYGRTDVAITKLNEIVADRYYAALDVVRDPRTGTLACRTSVNPAAPIQGATVDATVAPVTFTPGPNSGCRPVSVFGADPVDPAALAFFQGPDTSFARITQSVATASVSGDFGALFELPGGPVQFSLGGEYRREGTRFDPSANFANGRILTYNLPQTVSASNGSFDVKEGFAELNAPLLKDRPFARTLSVGASYRYSDYSTIGHTNTWAFNGVYAPARAISFRGSYGESVRAPNISELFLPSTGSFAFITDPCTPDQVNLGTQYRPANCKAALDALGVPANRRGTNDLQTGFFVFGNQGGNRNLRPETAKTWTAGVVLRPPVRGLTLSIDWYNIDLRGAITQVDPATLVNLCVDQPTLANPYCPAVTRAQGTGRVVNYLVGPQNVAGFRTAGADFNLDWSIRTARAGDFDLRLVGGYLHRLQFIPLPGADPINNVDQFGSPRWNFNFTPTWTKGGLTLNYNLRFVDNQRAVARTVSENDPLYAPAAQLRYRPVWQHDLQARYRLESGLSLYGGVINLTDQLPDPSNNLGAPVSPLGRSVYVGAQIDLGHK